MTAEQLLELKQGELDAVYEMCTRIIEERNAERARADAAEVALAELRAAMQEYMDVQEDEQRVGVHDENDLKRAVAAETCVNDLLAADPPSRGLAILEAADAMAAVLEPAVDFIQIFEGENAQHLALLMAMQLVAYRALRPAQPAGSEATG